MILVDTSVLIDFLKDRRNPQTEKLDAVIDSGFPYGFTELIYQEVLQGARTPGDERRLRAYMDTQTIYRPLRGLDSFADAASLYARCRARGTPVAGTVDCLIAQIAVENRLNLLHRDSDFDVIAKVEKNLKLF
jgi:predicted nucleic acid-binding protein